MTQRYPRFSRVALMDLRAWTAMLFTVFGLMLTVYGLFFVSDADLAKAGGANLDLWTGVGMLAFAAAFATWLFVRPPEIGEAKIGDPNEDVNYLFLAIDDGPVGGASQGTRGGKDVPTSHDDPLPGAGSRAEGSGPA